MLDVLSAAFERPLDLRPSLAIHLPLVIVTVQQFLSSARVLNGSKGIATSGILPNVGRRKPRPIASRIGSNRRNAWQVPVLIKAHSRAILELLHPIHIVEAARGGLAASLTLPVDITARAARGRHELVSEVVWRLLADVFSVNRVVVVLLLPSVNAVCGLFCLQSSKNSLVFLSYLNEVPPPSLSIQ